MCETSLEDMLREREWRAMHQRELISEHGAPLISFTMNIAGPKKVSPLVFRAFSEGVRALDAALSAAEVRVREIYEKSTGYAAFYSVMLPAERLKEICKCIEEAAPLGRLFDMDVIATGGEKLTRVGTRKCIVCDRPGLLCSRSRLHSLGEVRAATEKIIIDHFIAAAAARVGALAGESLLAEVYTTPKPGLVDRRNCGSHSDMSVSSFEVSAEALVPYFENCFKIGVATAGDSAAEAFAPLRAAGLAAEEDMYRATGGVNTHKGSIYSFGIVCAALGRLWCKNEPVFCARDILLCAGDIARREAESDFSAADESTVGMRLYLTRGIRGIRGEAADGFPSVGELALPYLSSLLARGMSENDAGVQTLIRLIASVDDTVLYKKGEDGAKFAKDYAARLIGGDREPSESEIILMDDEFIKRGLSPGGCADLLALSYFLLRIQKELRLP